jgi:GNAT superfamily N-acetyltransferase
LPPNKTSAKIVVAKLQRNNFSSRVAGRAGLHFFRRALNTAKISSVTVRTMPQSHPISDLRQQPQFCATVAERIWRAWWEEAGHLLAEVEGHMGEMLDDSALPFGLVAHQGDTYLGSALVIASDLEERPQFSPWVAAVWVEPDHRKRGIGAALVQAGADAAFKLGHKTAYLCAEQKVAPFYQALGWQRLEDNVGEHALTVLTLTAKV